MKKFYVVMFVAVIALVSNGFAAFVSPLDGVSDQSAFEGWVGDGAGPVPAGWSVGNGSATDIRTFRPYGYPGKDSGMGTTWPVSRDFTYIAQFTTSVAALANQEYMVTLQAGSFEWETGQADYTVKFGTVAGGVFTAFASDTERVIFDRWNTYIGDNTGPTLALTGISGAVAPTGVLAIQIAVTNIDNWWAAFDDVTLSTIPEPVSVLLLGIGSGLALIRRK